MRRLASKARGLCKSYGDALPAGGMELAIPCGQFFELFGPIGARFPHDGTNEPLVRRLAP